MVMLWTCSRSEDALYEEENLFDAAIIVTPHKLHPAMAIRALNAGKHVHRGRRSDRASGHRRYKGTDSHGRRDSLRDQVLHGH